MSAGAGALAEEGSPVRVLYVSGYARSGSTLLERLLGQVDGLASFGELRHIWFRSFLDNQLCGCGQPFRSCPFWDRVVGLSFGGFEHVHAEEVGRAKRRVDSFVNIPRIVSGGWTPRYRRNFARYTASVAALYRGIREVSGAEFLVDASKDPQHAYVLSSIPGFDVRVIHLLRDSRAVAYSWRRVRRRPEIFWEPRDMPRYPVIRTAFAWSLTNLGAGYARRLGLPYTSLRYEDLVRDARGELGRVLEEIGVGQRDLGFIGSGVARLEPSHTVSGNPVRFQSGSVAIRADEEWVTGMDRPRRSIVTALTLPQLARYGYRRDTSHGHRRPRAGPGPLEMVRTLRLAAAHRREPLAYGRAVADLVVRYLRNRNVDMSGRDWLDVGSGSGAIPEALERAGARVVGVDVEDRRAPGAENTRFVVGSGRRLPFPDETFDGVSCSNVLEHVPQPVELIDELLRVCVPGGILYLSWTNWWSPFGGHDWSPFHFFGARLGPRLSAFIRGRPPQHLPGESLFPVHVGTVLRLLRERDVRLLDVAPRYWPSLRFLASVPGLREVALWNCVILATVRPRRPPSSRAEVTVLATDVADEARAAAAPPSSPSPPQR